MYCCERRYTVVAFVGFIFVVTPASAQLDNIVVLHDPVPGPNSDGAVSLLDGNSLADTGVSGPAIFEESRGAYAGSGFIGVQSDNNVIVIANGMQDGNGLGNDNANFSRRAVSDLLPIGGTEEGFGVTVNTMTIFNNGAGFEDFVFVGLNGIPGVISNTVTRVPDLSRDTQQALDGLNGGPGQFGDGQILGSTMNSAGDLIFGYQFSTQPPGSQGRIRRQAGGNLAAGAGDEGLGTDAETGDQIDVVSLEIRSDDLLVLGKSNRIVELRTSNPSLTPDVGGFEVNTGQVLGSLGSAFGKFNDDVTALGVLSDNSFVVGLANGEISLWETDLQAANPSDRIARSENTTLLCPAGACTISSIAVQSDDDVIVGTEQGRLFRLDGSLGTTMMRDGLGAIADIGLLGGMASAGLAGDFNGDGRVDAADYTRWQDNLGAADESPINENGNGVNGVDPDDLAVWTSNFGSSNGTGNGSTAIPEPTCLLQTAVALLVAGLAGQRHQRKPPAGSI